ncbi:helix-turn-helix domain-containing protein [Streptosporangium sp. CA-115845]|uniref:helix-turn-helix domain-containing protein n=1 Tax=Streptosporangium sp. CA-115845 TaxID=3240071 RepID=UPI003D9178AD
MRIHQAYRYALDPTPALVADLFSHGGAARFAFNWALARVKAALDQRAAERSYGVPAELLTEVPWSLYALRKLWNAAKGEVAPWWAENSKEAYNTGLEALARALANWSASRKGSRVGKQVGFPGSSPSTAPPPPAGSPLAPSASRLIAVTSRCRGWA